MSSPITAEEFIRRAAAAPGTLTVGVVTPVQTQFFEAVFGPEVPAAAKPAVYTRPADSAQLQHLVRCTAEGGWSIWRTLSVSGSGASAGHPDRPGVFVDLSDMKQILALDPGSATALVEPGVTFAELRAHLAAGGHPFWLDCGPNAADSVAGSILDRALGETPYGDRLLMQCGFEICDGRGELLRTGMGALPGNNTWQLFKYNFGPYLDGLYSGDGYGLPTKAGFWIMPAPPHFHPFMVTLPDDGSLAAAVELLRPLKIGMALPGTVSVNHIDAEAALIERASPERTPDFVGLMQDGQLNTWNLYGAFYGLPDNVALLWDSLLPGLHALPGSRVFTDAEGREDAIWQLHRDLLRGAPAYSRPATALKGQLWFTVAGGLEGEDVRRMRAAGAGPLSEYGIKALTDFQLGWRTLFYRVGIDYDAHDFSAKRDVLLHVSRLLAEQGFAVSHACPALRGALSRQQTSPALSRLYAGIGEGLDPAGIFGPAHG